MLERALLSARDAVVVEVLVVDGGSRDRTREVALALSARLVEAAPGRAFQMNAGARQAQAEVLLFLHADSILPVGFGRALSTAMDAGCLGGRFDISIDSRLCGTKLVAELINLRSRASGLFTGDQALFVRREVFEQMGGFAPIGLMEDLDFARRLRRRGRVAALRQRVITSGRRWERHGVLRTILKMWLLRAAFYLGMDPERLARSYWEPAPLARASLGSSRTLSARVLRERGSTTRI